VLVKGADDATALRAISELLGKGLRSAETILDRLKETAPATSASEQVVKFDLSELPGFERMLREIYGDGDDTGPRDAEEIPTGDQAGGVPA
jgi:hypothetical protein